MSDSGGNWLTRASAIRIFLVDDHPILRTGLLNLLERQPDLVVVGAGQQRGGGVAAGG